MYKPEVYRKRWPSVPCPHAPPVPAKPLYSSVVRARDRDVRARRAPVMRSLPARVGSWMRSVAWRHLCRFGARHDAGDVRGQRLPLFGLCFRPLLGPSLLLADALRCCVVCLARGLARTAVHSSCVCVWGGHTFSVCELQAGSSHSTHADTGRRARRSLVVWIDSCCNSCLWKP